MDLTVTVNGTPVPVPDGTTVAAVVARLTGTASSTGVAVAVNGEVVPAARWLRVTVAPGDEVEVLTAMQGG
ncbi:MAG TPA: sulfur carrier protein ThiS [Kineosporiaceae bacterium]